MKLYKKDQHKSPENRFKHLYLIQKSKVSFKTLKNTLLIACTLFAFGCSNTDVGIQYYSLNAINTQAQAITTVKNNEDKTFVVINNIELADFLDTGGIVMQIDSHQIQISSRHQWADKLAKAIITHLVTSLSTPESHLYVETKTSKNDSLADKKLTLSFEQFTITNTNETVIAGFYTIESISNKNKQEPAKQSQKTFFDIRQPLAKDGYNHAVETFKHSLNILAKQIENSLISE